VQLTRMFLLSYKMQRGIQSMGRLNPAPRQAALSLPRITPGQHDHRSCCEQYNADLAGVKVGDGAAMKKKHRHLLRLLYHGPINTLAGSRRIRARS
jgi:hypothetical protein